MKVELWGLLRLDWTERERERGVKDGTKDFPLEQREMPRANMQKPRGGDRGLCFGLVEFDVPGRRPGRDVG